MLLQMQRVMKMILNLDFLRFAENSVITEVLMGDDFVLRQQI